MITTTDFAKMLGLGLGRAVIYARQHDMTSWRDIILNACLHCQSYDQQVEGARGAFMFDVIHRTADVPFYRQGILTGLAALTEADSEDVSQRYFLAGCFAANGNLEARQAMFDKFNADPSLHHYSAMDEIIQFFGEEGFKFVAKRVNNELKDDDDEYQAMFAYHYLQRRIGKDAAAEIFVELSADPETQRFAEIITAQESRSKARLKNGRPKLPYDELKERIRTEDDNSIRTLLHGWARTATTEDQQRAAQDLLNEHDPVLLGRYLQLFRHRSFPLDATLLFPLIDHEDGYIVRETLLLLQKVKSDAVRQLALVNIAQNRYAEEMAALLEVNYRPGDWAIFESISAQPSDNPIARHKLGSAANLTFGTYPDPGAEGTFLYLYETDQCGFCRNGFVENLHQIGKLPDWMREECRYDSYDDTRRFIKGLDRAAT